MLKVVATSAPSIFGPVAVAETMRDVFPDLMDILGSTFALSIDSDGGLRGTSPLPPLVRIYGGALEVFWKHARAVCAWPWQAEFFPPTKAS